VGALPDPPLRLRWVSCGDQPSRPPGFGAGSFRYPRASFPFMTNGVPLPQRLRRSPRYPAVPPPVPPVPPPPEPPDPDVPVMRALD
jgi:hypothetical protein